MTAEMLICRLKQERWYLLRQRQSQTIENNPNASLRIVVYRSPPVDQSSPL